MHSNSEEAFERIREGGLLSLRLMQAFEILHRHGPLTSNVANRIGKEIYGVDGWWKRMSDLKAWGMAEPVGDRKDGKTKQKNEILRAVYGTPRKPEKKLTARQILELENARLIEDNERLRRENARLREQLGPLFGGVQ